METPTHLTVSFTTNVICESCGHVNVPDLVIETRRIIEPLINSLKEMLMSTTAELHDLVSQTVDAVTALEGTVDSLSAKVEAGNQIDPADVQALRDAVAGARAKVNLAVVTSNNIQANPPDSTSTSSPIAAPGPGVPTSAAPGDITGSAADISAASAGASETTADATAATVDGAASGDTTTAP